MTQQKESVQDLFDKQQSFKDKLKEYKKTLSEELEGMGEYMELTEKMKELREKRNAIVQKVLDENPVLAEQIEDMKERVKVATENLNMAVLLEVQAGIKVEVLDRYKQKELFPILSVRFGTQQSLF